ncbi:MAG: hypothetical protein WBB69_08605 [Anaerolineales bacterium]
MNIRLNNRVILFLPLIVITIGTANCVSDIRDSKTSTPSPPLENIKQTQTLGPSPSETPWVTTGTTTQEPQTDERQDSYIFPSEIDHTIADIIQRGLEERLIYSPIRGEVFYSYVLLKPVERTSDDNFKTYLYVKFREFYVDRGELIEGGGGNIPAALTIEEKEQGWHIDLQTPTPGNQWGSSIQEIFPEDVWPLLFHPPPIPNDRIIENIIHQAEEHFGLVFDPEENSFPPAGKTPTHTVQILTLTPTPTGDLSTLELKVSGQAFISNAGITIQIDLYPKVKRPYYKGLVSSGWRVLIYQRNGDNNYAEGNVLILDELQESYNQYEFSVRTTIEEVQNQFENRRDLIYQIVDQYGNVAWQDDLYLFMNLSQFSDDGIPGDITNNGWVVGKPNLMDEDQIFYTDRQEKFIDITGIRGGFYELVYTFNLAGVTDITTTSELETLADELTCELFPYDDFGKIVAKNSELLSGEVISIAGLYSVYFPPDWLSSEQFPEKSYYLKITEGTGTTIKEDFFHSFPYIP